MFCPPNRNGSLGIPLSYLTGSQLWSGGMEKTMETPCWGAYAVTSSKTPTGYQ